MAGISTSLEVTDRMTAPLNRITAALYSTTEAFSGVDRASEQAFNARGVQAITQEIYGMDQRVQQLEGELMNANQRLEDMKSSSMNVHSVMKKIAGGLAALGIGAVLKKTASDAIDFASDLNEVQNVVSVTFGDKLTSVIDDWSSNTLNAFGINELSAKQFAGTMGAMLKSSGMSGDAVADMSMKLAELSGDMASFYNLDAEEAFGKIRAGISGETEPLKQLGINMSVANLEAYALSQGIKTSYKDMDQAAQTMLRYNYLLQATTDAQGDFARSTAEGSYSNQVKLMHENWKAFIGTIAAQGLPMLTQLMQKVNEIITGLSAYTPNIIAFGSIIIDQVMLIFDAVSNVASFFVDNWSVIAPIIMGIVAAFAAYNAVLAITTGIKTAISIAEGVHAAATGLMAIATGTATAAQVGLNGALWACPITWIVALVMLLIAAIIALIAWIGQATGAAQTGIGAVAGALMVAVAFIYNLFLSLLDLVLGIVNYWVSPWIAFANFFGNLFNDPISSVLHLFGDLADGVLGVLESIARAMDKLFGSSLADTISGWRDGLSGLVEGAVKEYGNGSYEKVMEGIDLSSESLGLKRMEYGASFDKGAAWGDNLSTKLDSAFDFSSIGDTGATGSTFGADMMEQQNASLGEIASNTGATADAVNISNENLKYMRDIAEQDAINRFTTAEIKVDMTNNNTVNSGMDIDGMISQLSSGVSSAMSELAQGVHA